MSQEAMTCQETIARLSEYLDSELTPETLRELEAHLDECAPCTAYLATYRKTRQLAAKVNRVELPEGLKVRIRTLLKGRRA